MAGPLDGIKILELARVAPGEFCTMLLADMGADVLKIETPPADGEPEPQDERAGDGREGNRTHRGGGAMSVRTSVTLAALAGAALGLGLLGFATAAEPSGPDLRLASFRVETVQPGQLLPGGPGQPVDRPYWYFVWRVENIGDDWSQPTTVKITCQAVGDSPPCPSEVVGSYAVPQLKPPKVPGKVEYDEIWSAKLIGNQKGVRAPLKAVKWLFTAILEPKFTTPMVTLFDSAKYLDLADWQPYSPQSPSEAQPWVFIGEPSVGEPIFPAGDASFSLKLFVPPYMWGLFPEKSLPPSLIIELEWARLLMPQGDPSIMPVEWIYGTPASAPKSAAWGKFPLAVPVKGVFPPGLYAVRAKVKFDPGDVLFKLSDWTEWRFFWVGKPDPALNKFMMGAPFNFLGKIGVEVPEKSPDKPKGPPVVVTYGPDLVVAKFWVETVQPGQQMPEGQTAQKPHWYFVWRVENIGDKHSGAATLKIDCQAQGGSPPCPAGVAKSYDLKQFWPKPEDPAEAKAKEYTWAQLVSTMGVAAPDVPVKWQLTATVDPDNKVVEKDKLNNVLVSDFPLQIDLPKYVGQVAMASSVKGGKGSALQRQAADEAAKDLDTLTKRLSPLQQDREGQLLLREAQALQRELAASPDPREADRLRRDAQRLTREVDRLEASLLREQQRAAAGGPAPAKPEAPAPGSQPDQPSGPPQVAAIPRPAAPARDPVAEEAAKELEALAKRLTALGANSEAQRFLREVQLLQRQLGSDPGQAPAILRDAQRLGREVDRLEASLRQPLPRGAPSRKQ